MAEYYQFAHSVQGYNHIKANKVCQDASGECHFEDVSIIAVADGHGSDNYIRTDRGSKFAVSAALTAIKAFVQEARENHLSAVPDSETELIQISKNILARWYTQVENDVACEPFQPEELAKVSEKYKQRYASGQYNAKAYGTTLIAVCMTNEGWFGIHIGDGKCVELLENGTLCEPIPWDEACEQNITTSICDSDAIEEFRYVIQKDFPAALFIGSDGIDDSYSSEMELHELYRNIFIVFADHGADLRLIPFELRSRDCGKRNRKRQQKGCVCLRRTVSQAGGVHGSHGGVRTLCPDFPHYRSLLPDRHPDGNAPSGNPYGDVLLPAAQLL